MTEKTYMIVRMFLNEDIGSKVLERELTLEEAQAHCRDPETSSSTCKSEDARALTKRHGKWFDGYQEEH